MIYVLKKPTYSHVYLPPKNLGTFFFPVSLKDLGLTLPLANGILSMFPFPASLSQSKFL